MTLAEMRTQIWKLGGEPSDLDPDVDSTYLDLAVNEGLKRVSMWKNGQGHIVRFHQLRDDMYWSTYTTTATITAVSNDDFPYYIDVTGLSTGDDRYNGWTVEITSGDADGERVSVVDFDSDNSRLYIHDAFSTEPAAADTIKVYKRFSDLLSSSHSWVGDHISKPSAANGGILEILKIEDVENKSVLERSQRHESFPSAMTDSGDPSSWYRLGDRIYFNLNVDEKRWFRMEFIRLPVELSSDTDEPEIDETFHWGIVLWGVHWIYHWQNDLKSTWAAEQRFNNFMRSTVAALELQSERGNSYGSLKKEN